MTPIGELTLGVTVAIFCLGVVFQAGRLTSRVEALEKMQDETKRAIDAIHTAIRHVEDFIVNGGR